MMISSLGICIWQNKSEIMAYRGVHVNWEKSCIACKSTDAGIEYGTLPGG